MLIRKPESIDDHRFDLGRLIIMFVGKPPGNYDRLLDFSRAVTGTLFFVPSATFLEDAANAEPTSSSAEAPQNDDPADNAPASRNSPDGSLGIGSLKGEVEYE